MIMMDVIIDIMRDVIVVIMRSIFICHYEEHFSFVIMRSVAT